MDPFSQPLPFDTAIPSRDAVCLISTCAATRLQAVRAQLLAQPVGTPTLIVGASRAAADELAADVARRQGGLFGLRRRGFSELALTLALPALARERRSPTTGLGAEALVTRAAFEARRDGALGYFAPVATMPGFARAVTSTLGEVRLAAVTADDLRHAGAAGADLAELFERVDAEADAAATRPRADVLRAAARVVRDTPASLDAAVVVLLDLPIASPAEAELVKAIIAAAPQVIAVCPDHDTRARRLYADLIAPSSPTAILPPAERQSSALGRLQHYLFSAAPPPTAEHDGSVEIFSAPGEGREATEIARRVLGEAARGVAFDEMAILLRAPQTYVGLLEHALSRAGVPAWFDRGTRRPDPAGRAFLALLACADEQLSARRFAEYLSLGQVPIASQSPEVAWSPPTDEAIEAAVPALARVEDAAPIDEAPLASERDRDRVLAGTLQAPWRWEELLVEAYVIGGIDRWRKRLPGLRHEFERRMRELSDEEVDSPRIAALQRDCAQLQHLEDVALPIVETLDAWRDGQQWAVWLERLTALAPRVLRQPARVMRVLAELSPLGGVGPVSLAEVRGVLTSRLRTLTHEPPRRRHGHVFIGSCDAARGRAFRVVFVPGLAERVFPQRLREDALLLDARRRELDADLAVRATRADAERLQLRLAVGAAEERVYVSYPRLELRESRARVPSFYLLEVARAISGSIPNYSQVAAAAQLAGGASLAWPAPLSPEKAIDDFEHDLAVLRPLLSERDVNAVAGRARYLVDLNPKLKRSVTERWSRHQPKWSRADGLLTPSSDALTLLAEHRLGARAYSLTALQRYATCPYQFLLSAVYRLSPLEEPAPLQRLDPLTRGSLFHEIQTEFYRTLQKNDQLPVTAARLSSARQQLVWAIARVASAAADRLAPAIERVWDDEIVSIRRDLMIWVEHLAQEKDWIPENFELAFGLPPDSARDPASFAEPALVDGRFRLRGSIDLVERNPLTRALRITDHKTGKNRTTKATVVHGGQVLQPVLYGLALESLTGETVYEGRLWFCTETGKYAPHPILLGESARRSGIEVLEVIDRAIERGPLVARPARDACKWCDFRPVCGPDEERRTRGKPAQQVADLEGLRRLP